MKKIIVFIKNFSQAFNKKNVSDHAASAAFFLFLSLIPMMMLVFAIMPYTSVTEEQMLNLVIEYTPGTLKLFVSQIVGEIYDMSAGIITISIIITIWSAGKGMQSLIRGLNVINGIDEKRGYFILRGQACLYTLAMMAATIIMMVLMMFGRTLYRILVIHMPGMARIKDFLLLIRYPISWGILVILFTVIYCFVPSMNQKFTKQLPGAVFSALVWSLASFFFSLYLKYFNGFSTYGSMATVIIVMIYMYMMMYIMLVGAYLNQWLGRSVNNRET